MSETFFGLRSHILSFRYNLFLCTMKKLYRSSDDRIISGVAAGIAEYFDLDPVFIRVAFVLLALLNGFGLLLYFVLLIVMPKRPSLLANSPEFSRTVTTEPPSSLLTPSPEEVEEKKKQRNMLIGIILIVLGVLLLLDMLLPEFEISYAAPLALVALGGYLLWKAFAQSNN